MHWRACTGHLLGSGVIEWDMSGHWRAWMGHVLSSGLRGIS